MNQLNNSTHYAAVYVEGNTDSPHLPKRVPTKKRMRMIAKEMNEILDGAQDYLLRHMLDDDLSDEAKNAVFKAAMEKAYKKQYYDNVDHKVVYFPTCKELVLKHEFLDEAEKFFYQDRDKFPSDYRRAISSSVRALEHQRLLEEQERNQNPYQEQDETSEDESIDELLTASMHVRLDADMVDKFAGSWKCQEILEDDIEEETEYDSDDDF